MIKTYSITESTYLENRLCEILNLDPNVVSSLTILLLPGEPIKVEAVIFAPKEINEIELSDFDRIESVE